MYIIYEIFIDKNLYGFESDHYYIGQHLCKKIDDNYMGSGKALKDIYRLYGKDKAQKKVLAITENNVTADILEVYFISLYREEYGEQVLNFAEGGAGIRLSKEYMAEAHEKTNAANKKLWAEQPERFLERNKKNF